MGHVRAPFVTIGHLGPHIPRKERGGWVTPDDRASESCLHCEINDLVQEHVGGLEEPVDIVPLAANMAESLVDLILLAPEEEQAKLLAGDSRWAHPSLRHR
jgi:hypothetical protein